KAPDGVPRALYAKMAELGWMGLVVPETDGGLGLSTLDLALVLEELGRAAAPGPFLPTQLVTHALLRAGSTAQRKAWLPRLGTGWPLLARLLDLGALGIAADSLGGAARALEMAVEYSKVRQQFGRPIGSFQALKHMAAEMVSEVEPSRSLVWHAAYAFDRHPREAARAAAMAKARLGDVYSRTVNRSVQMHGGIGFTWEHDLHLWFKRARWNEVAFG